MSDDNGIFQPGEKIGDYEVVSTLGVGATGTVYLAQHTVLKKLFAVKVLSGELAFMPEFVRVFQHEAQIVAALNHENIVPVHNFGQCNGFYYYVMDFVNGGTLEDVRRRNGGRLRPSAAIELISAVARGLAYAHAYGVVHRDLKPENILLTRTGVPQITDFGMAHVDRRHIAGQRRIAERRAKAASKFRAVVGGHAVPGQTSSQTQISIEENSEDKPELEGGTEGYIAPEVARGSAATPRADVYALGALLHFLLVGETPPEPGQISPELHKVGNRPLVDLLNRSLSVSPVRRFSTAKEFLDALERVGDAPNRIRRGIFYTLGALVVCSAFVFAFSFGEKSQQRKNENQVRAAAQKIFESELSGEDVSEKPLVINVSEEDVRKETSGANVKATESSSDASDESADATAETEKAESKESSEPDRFEREYWERLCSERTGRRAIIVNLSEQEDGLTKISSEKIIALPRSLASGTYNVYLRTDGETPEATVPVRIGVGDDQVTRLIKFSGTQADAKLRFFSILDVHSSSEEIFLEVPNPRGEDYPEVGITEIEIRPTFSNADFSRMFGEFLSALSEK